MYFREILSGTLFGVEKQTDAIIAQIEENVKLVYKTDPSILE